MHFSSQYLLWWQDCRWPGYSQYTTGQDNTQSHEPYCGHGNPCSRHCCSPLLLDHLLGDPPSSQSSAATLHCAWSSCTGEPKNDNLNPLSVGPRAQLGLKFYRARLPMDAAVSALVVYDLVLALLCVAFMARRVRVDNIIASRPPQDDVGPMVEHSRHSALRHRLSAIHFIAVPCGRWRPTGKDMPWAWIACQLRSSLSCKRQPGRWPR